MTAKFFADTNVALYTIGSDDRKKTIARKLIALAPVVSTQVINECVAVGSMAQETIEKAGRG